MRHQQSRHHDRWDEIGGPEFPEILGVTQALGYRIQQVECSLYVKHPNQRNRRPQLSTQGNDSQERKQRRQQVAVGAGLANR